MTFKIANVICAFNSASGGPPRTVALIAKAGLGLWRAELFTTDAVERVADSLLTKDFTGHINMLPASSQRVIGGMLMMSGVTRTYEAQLLHAVAPDVIHIHGMWNMFLAAFASSAIRHRIPYIVAPHGMLEPWSLSVRSRRKSIALKTYQGRILAHAAAIHATSVSEAENLRRLPCISAPIFVVPNAVELPLRMPHAARVMPQRRILLFMSRVHPKKGLDMLLDSWNQVRPRDWTLMIVGNGEPAYVERLKRFCETERVPDVQFHGHVDGEAREAIFERASALALPTYSENFGNVIAEAMIRGLPVLTTTGTPWSVIADQRLGWYFEPNVGQLRQALAELTATAPAELQAMGERGRRYAATNLSIPAVRERLLYMYRSVMPGQVGQNPQTPRVN
jgi:glycosyltransferase involved in cell wall biosynthesis